LYNTSRAKAATAANQKLTMYNSLTRIQNTFGFFTTVAFVVAAFIAVSDLLAPRAPDAGIFQKTSAQV
jgi:hypothetical protein